MFGFTALAQVPFAALPEAAGATTALTGVSSTGSVGSLICDVQVQITGETATGGTGVLTPGVAKAATGNLATGAAGAVNKNNSAAVSGNVVFGFAGYISPDISVGLSGCESVGEVGAVTVQPQPIVIIEKGSYGKRERKRILDERKKQDERRRSIIDAFETIVEGRPEVAEKIAEPFIITQSEVSPVIDFDALFADLDRVQQILDASLELDDEDILILL